VLVRLRLTLVESDAEAVVTYDVLARWVLAQVTHLDMLAAFLARGIKRDHFGAIPNRTASVL
jgi:RNA-binding protein YlmH